MEIDDERLIGWDYLCTDKQLIRMEVTIPERDSPAVRREVRHLQFALSSQTGSCEAHRHSALGERLPGQYHKCANHQKCGRVHTHRPSGSHSVSCSRCHWTLSCCMNATKSGSLRMRSRFGSLAK